MFIYIYDQINIYIICTLPESSQLYVDAFLCMITLEREKKMCNERTVRHYEQEENIDGLHLHLLEENQLIGIINDYFRL
jgi:hypothetical protein